MMVETQKANGAKMRCSLADVVVTIEKRKFQVEVAVSRRQCCWKDIPLVSEMLDMVCNKAPNPVEPVTGTAKQVMAVIMQAQRHQVDEQQHEASQQSQRKT